MKVRILVPVEIDLHKSMTEDEQMKAIDDVIRQLATNRRGWKSRSFPVTYGSVATTQRAIRRTVKFNGKPLY